MLGCLRSYMRTKFIMFISLLLLTSSCARSLPIQDFPPSFTLEKYTDQRELISQVPVAAKDPIYQRLRENLFSEKSGWKVSVATYAPGPYIFSSSSLVIRCYEDFVVMDVIDPSGSRSFERRFPGFLEKVFIEDQHQ